MENVTKALIIAGSILIVILLIAFGLRILNSSKVTTEATETKMDTTSATAFNNKFMPYVGENKTKSQIISLINLAVANNAVSSHKVSIQSTINAYTSYFPEGNFEESKKPDGLIKHINDSTSTKFKVFIAQSGGMKNGYISLLTVSEQ